MNHHEINFRGETLWAMPTGALWWPDYKILTVSDLHLGKSERIARLGGPLLPPFETLETLEKLDHDVEMTGAETVICLGDSFDDSNAARNLPDGIKDRITRLQAGRKWIWIEGNHDPGPTELAGEHLVKFTQNTLVFRHIANPECTGEISGHYHPKITVRGRGHGLTCACFLCDDHRIILPAYGAYTGGLNCAEPVLQSLLQRPAYAITTGKTPRVFPFAD